MDTHDEYTHDDWPTQDDGKPYDGKDLLRLVRINRSPFAGIWDVEALVHEVEEKLNTKVLDVNLITKGANSYGLFMTTPEQPVVARLSKEDVNMPGFCGRSFEKQAREAHFEAAVYHLLRGEDAIKASCLLWSRAPAKLSELNSHAPHDLSGRHLSIFKAAPGKNNVFYKLDSSNQFYLLEQLAHIRAALFLFNPPKEFVDKYLLDRLFEFMPGTLSMPITPTREFWIHVLESKIRATIGNLGDMIAWESDNETVGPVAFAAKQSLLRAVPHILPKDTPNGSLYRFVLEHGDFGIHNASIDVDGSGRPNVTSIYDFDMACIWPAILSDPSVAVCPVDLITDQAAEPIVTRLPEETTQDEMKDYMLWATHYIKRIYRDAPEYREVIQAGKDFRYLWYTLRDWRGENPEQFFGALGEWAESRIQERGG